MLDADSQKMAEELLFSEKKKPSFAKKLFFGDFESTLIFPFPQPSKKEKFETDDFLNELKSYARDHIDPAAIDQNSAIPRDVIEGLGGLGLLSCTIPANHGGKGMSQYSYCRAMEFLASHCASCALVVNAHQSIGMRSLLLFGTEDQKKKWLPRLAKGSSLAAFALTEPNAGSDAAGIETKAIYDAEKNVYRISGQKQWITNGSVADILTVMARTEDGKITAFLVTPDMKGFKILAKSLDKVGMRGSITSNLLFDNLEVPAENILGPKGGGLKVALTSLDYGRITFGATCTGIAKELIRSAKEHALNRYQFKQPLASFALVKQKLAHMYALTYAMESTTLLTAGLMDHGVEDVMLEAAILKVFNSDSLWSILYDTMQIYGGRSFFKNLPLERNMRDARLNMIGEGSNEVLRGFIGAVGMRDVGMELKGLKESSWFTLSSWKEAVKWMKRYTLNPSIPVKTPTLRGEAHRLEEAVSSFGIAVFKALVKHKEGIVDKQLVLNRIAEAAMSIYTMTAVLSRLDRESESKQLTTKDLEVGKYYCKIAVRNIHKNLHPLFDPLDEKTEAVADVITGRIN